jgi:ATP-dependent Zn protease
MIITRRGFIGARMALVFACLACALLASAAGALGAESAIHYEKETLQSYQQQLAGGQIESVTINKFLRTLRVTLKNGKHVLARYAAHEESKTAAALSAKHVPTTVLSKEAATKEGGHKTKHKLRYIAGGVVLLVIIIVGAVLLTRRKRYGGD